MICLPPTIDLRLPMGCLEKRRSRWQLLYCCPTWFELPRRKRCFWQLWRAQERRNWGSSLRLDSDVAERQTVHIMRCLLLIECQASHGEIRITNMANDLWYNYVIKDGGNRKNTIWNRHMVATWKSFGRSDRMFWVVVAYGSYEFLQIYWFGAHVYLQRIWGSTHPTAW